MTSATQTARRTFVEVKQRAQEAAGGAARFNLILLLAAILALDTGDKAIVSAVAGSLKQAFDIGNTDVGILIASVSFAGAALALPFGSMIDRINRKRLLVALIALWAVAMVVSGTATSFTYLLVTRIFLGGVTAVASPAVASLTGDFFPARERAGIYGLILAGELVGTGAGFFVSGEVSALIDWHWSFYLAALPSAALALAILRYLPEPKRGGQSWMGVGGRASEGEQARRQIRRAGVGPREELVLRDDPRRLSIWWAVSYLVRIPTYRLLVIASALGYHFFAGIRGFAMIYLTEHYGVSRGTLSALVIIIGLGALAGVMAGGRLSRLMLDRGWIQARVLVPGAALFLATLFIGPGMWTSNVYLGIGLLTLGTAMLAAANPPIDAARLDIVPALMWGRGESGRMALRALLEGGAPILFGAVSSWLGGGEVGLKWTYMIMLVPLLAASALAIPAYFSYPRDVATAAASAERLRDEQAPKR